jgi:spermidine synthase
VNLLVLGFVSLLAQVVLLRELSVAFYGVELAYLLALAVWMAGTAAGAAVRIRRRGTEVRRPVLPAEASGEERASSYEELASRHEERTAGLIAIAAVAVPLDIALVRASRLIAGAVPGAYLPLERQALVLVVAVAPLSFALGIAFRRAASSHVAAGGSLAGAYALETAGAAAAGVAATMAFRSGAQTLAAAIALSGVALGWAVLNRRGRGRRVATAVVLTAALAGAWWSGGLDATLTRWDHAGLAVTRDTPYARIALTRAGPQVSVFENDVLVADSESASGEELAHLVALQHPAPRRILLLGGTAEGLDRELVRHQPAVLDHIEQDAAMADLIRALLPGRAAPTIADPRAWLRTRSGYDLIILATGEPVSGRSNRFYTREFLDECARGLAPGGVLGLRLRTPANYLAPWALLRAASVARAVHGAFRFVEYLPGTETTVLASNSPLPSPDVVVERMATRAIEGRLVTAGYLRYLYTDDRREELREAFTHTTVPENRDARPIAYLFAAADWLSKFRPGLIGAGARVPAPEEATRLAPWLTLVVACAVLSLARRRTAWRRAALAFSAGAAGMLLETVVLLLYQSRQGALFDDLGALVTAFMAGSAAGAAAFAARPPGRAAARLLLTTLAIGGLTLAWRIRGGGVDSLLEAGFFLAAAGATVAALFARAGAPNRDESRVDAGRLYAADVVGGCVGCLAGGLVLIPLAGLDATALGVAALGALALIVA